MLRVFLIVCLSFLALAEDYSELLQQEVNVRYSKFKINSPMFVKEIQKSVGNPGFYKISLVSNRDDLTSNKSPRVYYISQRQLDLLSQLQKQNLGKTYWVEHDVGVVKPRAPKGLSLALEKPLNLEPLKNVIREVGLYFETSGNKLHYPVSSAGLKDLKSLSNFSRDNWEGKNQEMDNPSEFILKRFVGVEYVNENSIKKELSEQMFYLNTGKKLIPVYVVGDIGETFVVVPRGQTEKFLNGAADRFVVLMPNVVKETDKKKYDKRVLQVSETEPHLLQDLSTLGVRKFYPVPKTTIKNCSPSIMNQLVVQ